MNILAIISLIVSISKIFGGLPQMIETIYNLTVILIRIIEEIIEYFNKPKEHLCLEF